MKKKRQAHHLRAVRKQRIRARLRYVRTRPRLVVFRSNQYTYAQLIDDRTQKTVASASSREVKEKKSKTDAAAAVGALLAERAVKAGFQAALFDRGSYRYHGRVKALAEAARKAGLKL